MSSIIAFFILGGAFFGFIAAVGVIRLPDMYTRLHAASKSSTLGVMMMMTGTFLYFWYVEGYVDTELILAVLFIFSTAPVAAHMLSRSAFHADVEPYQLTILNELKRDETGASDFEDHGERVVIEGKRRPELENKELENKEPEK
ncbi:monovalent cation/H(+) antiporter subunit G [Salinicoccus sp. HZC-1]|uniref:monovalent cation/H(+) antiporter subunit G n=1 Tax=Salinicoccus sp. HZC-1 TaxID=3385497 RepID=UPI00398B2D99